MPNNISQHSYKTDFTIIIYNYLKNIFLKSIFICFILLSQKSFANYPNLSGDIIINLGLDKLSAKESDIKQYNSILETQTNLSLNINRNWSVKTLWQSRKFSKDEYINKQSYNPILANDNRQISPSNESLFIEELKLDFRNEDLEFFIGKYNPNFGNAWNKKRRSSIFTNFFGRDYQLREKIGLGITAIFEESELSFFPFFNDNTDLSNSAINRRGKNRADYQMSGNNGSLSSYVIALTGKNFLTLEDLSYHLAYKKLDVDNNILAEENGYIASFEYLFDIGYKTSIVPFYEIVVTNNIHGTRDKDVTHQIAALNFNYSSWNLTASYFTKDISYNNNDILDKYIEYNIGYRINNNIKIDISRLSAKEDDIDYSGFYTIFTYMKEF
ncbi:hypothetical protein N9X24_00775 [Rickettsiales bacterium]|nr:hypothetical protein [Rickettsiales bacterium]